jgi:valyl-tRNA synthetase
LSDIEVEHDDVAGEIVTFRYELSDGSGHVSVATTRVETMLGDTGIAVHPDDERYSAVVGKTVTHPFFPDRSVTIVADPAVDPEFGTGAVKATPAHDPTDFEIGQRAGLDAINIFNGDAKVNAEGGPFEGMDRYEARRAVRAALEEKGLVEKVEQPYVHAVGHCYRCGTEVEPWLSEQWFVKMKPLAAPAVGAVRDGRVRILPERFAKSYFDWMENIRDWCISRQIWWGHRIPVWYCDDGHTVVALEDPDRCPECGSETLEQDPDVLDTWFSSQLWPFSTLGWPEQTDDLRFFYPTTLMITGYEILYLWVARMIVSGLYFMDEVPFKDVLIHGIVRDPTGKKMSKSLGNVVDPLDLIDRFGADALRFSLASSATSGNDVNFSEARIEGARNFANKLWNATRFVLMSLGDERPGSAEEQELSVADRWILSRLDHTTRELDEQLEAFNLAEAMRSLHQFIWTEFCDWYIELAKLELTGERAGVTKAVLVHVLDTLLRLLHPVMPFLTEELWSKLRPGHGSIMQAPWPVATRERDPDAEGVLTRFQDLVGALRRLKVDHDIPQGKRIPVGVVAPGHAEEIEGFRPAYLTIARLGSLDILDALPTSPGTATTITPAGIQAAVELGRLGDLGIERKRLEAKLDECQAEIRRAEGKLANKGFVAKAPPQVVEKERAKLEEQRAAEAKVRDQLAALGE